MTTAERLRKEGIEQGMQQSIQQGEKRKAIDDARRMKEEGDSVDKIARITGLSTEEVEQL